MIFNNSVYIIGASGFIGKKLFNFLDITNKFSVGRHDNDTYIDLTKSDFSEFFSIVKKDDVVVFLAAISSPDVCERNYEEAYKINVTNTVYLIGSLLKKGVKVLFTSSDAVFGTSETVCFDDSEKSPFGKYGKMKSEVEEHFKHDRNFFSIRLSYVLAEDDKFSMMIAEHAHTGKNLDVFDGFERNVIALEDVLLGIQNIIKFWDDIDTRVINFSGKDLVSRQNIVTELAKQKYPELVYSFIDAPDIFWQGRPKVIKTGSKFLESILNRPTKSYKDCIKEYSSK
ncbi:NAD(P)-dependent oxidoreductase [Vibrio cholerae]|uniref:NAD-dependent epimerase/dehydratase family protein n=1 Tax=Vibrio cholerae TaxID=666 RepID=UPI0011572B50|nr:NAD(P)-dependent oxidoreductase [Vibrio cholerae]TQP52314.1 NAD(P)-dependent oxidoreductase [Vibrio cholerae]